MRRTAVAAIGLAAALGACHRVEGSDWPVRERKRVVAECRGASGKDHTEWQCDCLYDALPGLVSWHEFEAWRDSPRLGTTQDPAITHTVAEVSAKCVVDHMRTQ